MLYVSVVVVPVVGDAILLVEYVPLLVVPTLFVIALFVVEPFALLSTVPDGVVAFSELVLSVVTGEVYVGFVAVLGVEYVLVVVCAFAMPIPNRHIANKER